MLLFRVVVLAVARTAVLVSAPALLFLPPAALPALREVFGRAVCELSCLDKKLPSVAKRKVTGEKVHLRKTAKIIEKERGFGRQTRGPEPPKKEAKKAPKKTRKLVSKQP